MEVLVNITPHTILLLLPKSQPVFSEIKFSFQYLSNHDKMNILWLFGSNGLFGCNIPD